MNQKQQKSKIMKKSKNLKVVFTAIIMIIIAQTQVYSQWNPKTLNVAFISESVSVPFGQIVTNPVHPGVSVGTDLMVKDQTSWYRSFGVEAGYYYHELYEHAIMLDGIYKFGYTFNFKLRANLTGALGYKHSILSGDTYVLKSGTYTAQQHPGKSQVNTKIGFGLAYPVTNKVSLTADYQGMIAIPYAPEKEMPFSTHALLKIGTVINF